MIGSAAPPSHDFVYPQHFSKSCRSTIGTRLKAPRHEASQGACSSDAIEIAHFSVLAQDTEDVSCEQRDHWNAGLVLWQELRLVMGGMPRKSKAEAGQHQGHDHCRDHTEIRPEVRTKSFDRFGVFRRVVASSGSS